ncbi:MAG: hypothetical protein IPM92_02235 [Saprospiraceae bacterium]|nr:hypothetical protein [Saprospiraceae bacterium]
MPQVRYHILGSKNIMIDGLQNFQKDQHQTHFGMFEKIKKKIIFLEVKKSGKLGVSVWMG